MTIISNKTSLIALIDIDMTAFNYLKPYQVNIESLVNSSLKNLDLEVYNFYGDSTGKDFIIERGKGYIILKHDSI